MFGGPKSRVAEAIEAATSDGHSIEDIEFHMQICDMINETDAAAKDAARVLKKKLEAKRPLSLVKTLTVLETAVKNCNKRFHVYIAEKSFVAALEKFVVGKNAVGGIAREKGLGLIQAWAEAFKPDPALGLIRELYLRLLGEGVEFPALSLDDAVPVVSPQISTSLFAAQGAAATSGQGRQARPSSDGLSEDERMARELDRQFREEDAAAEAARNAEVARDAETARTVQANLSPRQSHQPSFPPAQGHSSSTVAASPPQRGRGATRTVYRVQQLAPGQRVTATPTQLTKLRADLAIVKQNAGLLSELLRGLGPTERARDNELIAEVASTCASMQTRVTELCDQVDNEDLIVELLAANDDLNDAQHALRVRTSQELPGGQTSAEVTPAAQSQSGPLGVESYNSWLPGGQSQATAMPTRPPPQPPSAASAAVSQSETPEFDMFGQTRDMSMADRLHSGPGYVTGDSGPSDEPSYMEVAPSFLPQGQSSVVAQFDPMTQEQPEYAEIAPSPDRQTFELPGQITSPDDTPTIYDAGETRALSESERRRLDQKHDALFSL